MFAEQDRHVPFQVKRVFAIYDVAEGAQRGRHAHRTQHQFLVMLAGSCLVSVDEGNVKFTERLDSPTQGLYVPPLIWIELTQFDKNAVCLVLTSDLFSEADYIRDHTEFASIVASRDHQTGR